MSSSIPSRKKCIALFHRHNVPENIIMHSLKVNAVAMIIAGKLNERGHKVNSELVRAASLLHDIDKIYDIKNNEGNHGAISRKILEEEGFFNVAEIVEKHVIRTILDKGALSTLEEKIVFYADKRVLHDKIVSLDVRFSYFKKTYPKYLDVIMRAEPLTKDLERELMDLAGIREDEIDKVFNK